MTYEQLVQKYKTGMEPFYANPADFAIEPFRIFGPVYYVGDKHVCVHLVDTGDGLLLIDSGYPHTKHLLVESIYHLGFDPHDIRCILHTHAHADHFGASSEFRKLYGCELVISRIDAEGLANGTVSTVSAPLKVYPEFQRTIEDGEVFKMGNISILCRLIPGHTSGTMAFFFDVTENGQTLRAGLFGGAGLGCIRRCSLEKWGLPLSLRQQLLDSVERMRSEHVDVHLGNHPYNNHTLEKRAQQLESGGNPFIDPTSWGSFLDHTKATVEKMLAEEEAERA